MGKRGPKAIPNPIAIAKGDPGKRARKARGKEPKPPTLDEMPEYLPELAKTEWKRLLAMAAEMGDMGAALFTQADRKTLESYCIAAANLEESTIEIEKNGAIQSYFNEDGSLRHQQRSPWVAIQSEAIKVIKAFSPMFGFSPADRARMAIEIPKPKVDKIEQLLEG